MTGHHVDQSPSGVIFDGDDTLWYTEPLYDEARAAARAAVEKSADIGAQWEELQRRIDVENVTILGFSPERFPISCVQAYEQLLETLGLNYAPELAAEIRRAAEQVFNRDPALVPGVHETLRALRADRIRLALLTKGDPGVQRRRVAASGLEGYFDLVRIVLEKSPNTIRAVAAELGVQLENAWMVGNSVRSDVIPALEAGIRAIWVDAHVWEYERTHDHMVDTRVIPVSQISEVPSVIASNGTSNTPVKRLGELP